MGQNGPNSHFENFLCIPRLFRERTWEVECDHQKVLTFISQTAEKDMENGFQNMVTA